MTWNVPLLIYQQDLVDWIEREHQCSQLIIALLRGHILNQEGEYDCDILNEQMQKRAQLCSENRHRCQEEAEVVREQLPQKLQKAVELAKQKRYILLAYCSATI